MATKIIKKKKKWSTKKLVYTIVCSSILFFLSLGLIIFFSIMLSGSLWYNVVFKDAEGLDVHSANGFDALRYALGDAHAHYSVYAIIISILAIIVVFVTSKIISLLGKIPMPNKKASTAFSLIRSLAKWGIILLACFFVLQAWGLKPETILASIGILALIIGLGCQTLISDVVAGIFLVADNAFEVGDIVVIDDFRGTIVEIGLKSTKLEDAGGNIKIISNSAISSMVNLTDSLSLAIVEISIPYEENLKRTETLLIAHLKEMKKNIPALVEGPYYKGVEDMADSAVILKVIAKVKEEDRFQATRDMKRDIYMFLNDNQITVPYPQLTITQGPNPADHPEWVDMDKEEEKAVKEAQKQQAESKDAEPVNDIQ